MTNITYNITDSEIRIEAKGHAGYAETGKDIVCSAISVLLETLIAYLIHEEGCKYSMRDGYLLISATGNKAVIAGEMTVRGLRMVEKNYPEYLRVIGCSIN